MPPTRAWAACAPSALPTDRALAMTVGGEDAIMFTNVFPKTASGKVELASSTSTRSTARGCRRYRPVRDAVSRWSSSRPPRTSASPRRSAACRRATRRRRSRCIPTTRAPAGLADGVRVRVWNDLGEVHLPLAITDAIRPGVVSSLKGAWMQDQRQRPDRLRARPRPPRRHLPAAPATTTPRRGRRPLIHRPSPGALFPSMRGEGRVRGVYRSTFSSAIALRAFMLKRPS